jgi:hypothetical protein
VKFRSLNLANFVFILVSMSQALSVFMSMSLSCQFLFGAINIYVRHGDDLFDSQGQYEVAQKLKESQINISGCLSL